MTLASSSTCGVGGLACQACASGQLCSFGTCTSQGSGGGTGGGSGGGGSAGGGSGGGATGGGGGAPLRVFVTSTSSNGALMGPAGADAVCASQAAAASLGGTWRAYIGSSAEGSASSRLGSNGPWYQQPAGAAPVLTFSNRPTTLSALLAPLVVLENGAALASVAIIWTGTGVDGSVGSDCSGWTAGASTGSSGTLGRVGPGAAIGEWTGFAAQDCNSAARLLCFEEAPPPPRRMFVTSTASNGALGGTAGADARCNTIATAAGKPGNWKAFVSTAGSSPVSARLRFAFGGPWAQHPAGAAEVITFTSKASLDGSPIAPITTNESGGTLSGPFRVWTGTNLGGGIGTACVKWSAGASTGTLGTYGEVGTGVQLDRWTGVDSQDCSMSAGLICLED